MNTENTKKLFDRFTFLRSTGDMTKDAMVWGFDHDDGWFQLIWDLCEGIDAIVSKDPLMRDGVLFSCYEKIKLFFKQDFKWPYKEHMERYREYMQVETKGFVPLYALNYKSTTHFFLHLLKKYIIRLFCIPMFSAEPFKVMQVKEKLGGLRFYTNFGTEAIYDLIDEAEKKSETLCEICGNLGIIRDNGWLKCLCDEHAKEGKDEQASGTTSIDSTI